MKNVFERNPNRALRSGLILRFYPFHVSLEGLESRVLCRDDDDYDAVVKIICVCTHRCECYLIVYVVMSNHAHFIILAASQEEADRCGAEVKRMCAMFFRRKYGVGNVMHKASVSAKLLDSDRYLRNAMAYDIRNAVDNCNSGIQDYKWSSYGAYFCESVFAGQKVSNLSARQKKAVMHTADDLSDVSWMLDGAGRIVPKTACEWRYLEAAFLNNQAFFMKMIGISNIAELQYKLVECPRQMMCDDDFLRAAMDISRRWYQQSIHELPVDKKYRLVKYVWNSFRTSPAQLARVFELSKEAVSRAIGIKSEEDGRL